MLPSNTRMVSRAEDSSQMINTLRNCRTISTKTYRGLEASIEHLGSTVADRIWRWVQHAIEERPVFWQGKTLGTAGSRCSIASVQGVWRLVHMPVAFTLAGRGPRVFGFPIRVSRGLLVEADHVSSRIAEPRRDLRRVRADRLHDLTSMGYHRVKGRRHAVHHDVKEQPGLCRGRAPQHPRPAHFAHRVVKRRAAIATLAVLPAEDLLVEACRPRNVRGRHLDVTDLSIRKRGGHHHSFHCAIMLYTF